MTLTDPAVTDPNCDAAPALATPSGDDGDGDFEVGETWTYECSYLIDQADIDAGEVDNTADADASYTDTAGNTAGASSEDTETVLIPQVVTLTIDKEGELDTAVTGGATVANPGDRIDYTFDVTNTGNVTLTDPAVTDPNCDAAPALATPSGDDGDGDFEVGETWTYECSYLIDQADIDAGQVDNTGTARAFGPLDDDTTDTDDAFDTDDETVLIPQVVTLTIDKEGELDTAVTGGATVANPGDRIDYTFDVTNTGNVPSPTRP